MNYLISGVTLVLALATAAMAQDRQWLYVGQAEIFSGPEDFPYAQVCVPSQWTPANSGLPALALQWATTTFETWGELNQAIENRGQCDLAVLPAGTGEQRADLLAKYQSFHLSDMTEALVAASGEAPAGDTGEPSRTARKTAEAVGTSCAGNAIGSSYIDCPCLASLALDGLQSGRFAASENNINTAASTISYALTKNGIPEACINDAGITALLDRQVELRIRWPLSGTDIVLTDPDGYRACVISEGLARFRANPTLVGLDRSGNFISQAILACNKD